jgi:hypothetical protein
VYSLPSRASTSTFCHSTRPPRRLVASSPHPPHPPHPHPPLYILYCSNVDGLDIAKRRSNLIVHLLHAHKHKHKHKNKSQWPSRRMYVHTYRILTLPQLRTWAILIAPTRFESSSHAIANSTVQYCSINFPTLYCTTLSICDPVCCDSLGLRITS